MKRYVVVESKKYGLTMADFFRHLLIKQMEKERVYPEFEASDSTIKAYLEAREEEKRGELIEVGSVEKFLKDL